MPTSIPPTVLTSDQGCAIAIVHLDHTVDVWRIPPNAVITIQPQTGLGNVIESSENVSKSIAVSDVDDYLGSVGAQ